ncbi:MAG: beta strand repeat-containing protein, partial [Bacteroidia bacterium]
MKTNIYTKVIYKYAFLSFLFLLNIPTNAQTITTNNLSGTEYCGGETINISYTITGTFIGLNTFTAQLSDGNGDFSSSQNIGQLASNNSGNIIVVLPPSSIQGYAYRIRVVSNSPAIIGSDNGVNLIINPMATANAGLDQSICANSIVNLSGSLGTVAPFGNWSTSGSGTFNNSSNLTGTYTPSIADILNQSVVLTLTTIDPVGPCLAIADDVTITLNSAPIVDAGTDKNVCILTNTVNLNGSIGGSASSLNWSTLGTGSFNNSVLLNAIYTPSNVDKSTGFVKLILTTNDPAGPCTEVRDTLQINFNSVASINAGADQTICATDNITLLSNTSAISGTLNWTSSGNGIFYNGNSLTPTYVPGTNDVLLGSINLTVTNSNINNSCDNATDVMVLTINPSAIVNAGSDISVCENNNSIKLFGTIAGSSSSASWKSTGSGVFSDTNDLKAIYTFSIADKAAGFVKLALRSNDPAGPCIAVTDTLIISFNPLATANAGTDQIICENSAVNISGTVGGSATNGFWTSSSNNQFISYDSVTTYTPNLAEIASGSFFITFNSDDPYGPCNAAKDSMMITINSLPTVNAGFDKSVCVNTTSVNLLGSFGGSASSITWSTLGNGTFNNTSLTNAIYTPSSNDTSAGFVKLVLTTNNPAGPCEAISDTMMIRFIPIPSVNAGADKSICAFGITSVTLSGTSNATSGLISWSTSGTGAFFSGNSLTPAYFPSSSDELSGSVTITITNFDAINSCVNVSDQMILKMNYLAYTNAGFDFSTCSNNTSALLNGSFSGSATSAHWTTTGNGTFNDSSLMNATYTFGNIDKANGFAKLVLISNDSNGACGRAYDTLKINLIPEPIANAGPDQIICGNSIVN